MLLSYSLGSGFINCLIPLVSRPLPEGKILIGALFFYDSSALVINDGDENDESLETEHDKRKRAVSQNMGQLSYRSLLRVLKSWL